jgi:hypothetical protein
MRPQILIVRGIVGAFYRLLHRAAKQNRHLR